MASQYYFFILEILVFSILNDGIIHAKRGLIQMNKKAKEDTNVQKLLLKNGFVFGDNHEDDLELPHAYLSNGDIRLASDDDDGHENTSTVRSGRLELYMETLLLEGSGGGSMGSWGTVCGEKFSMAEANVACRQLGFMSAKNWTYSSQTKFGQGNETAPIFLNGIKCSRGNLYHLMRCRSSTEPTTTCSHEYDVALYCDSASLWSNPYKGQVRLVNAGNSSTPSSSSGRVEVYQANTWGTVCNREFNQAAGDSVCRQLGYTNAIAISDAIPGSGLVWVDNITCAVSSSCFTSCYKNNRWSHTCNHTSDVAVQCDYDTSLAVENTAGNRRSCSIGVFPLSMLIAVVVMILSTLAVIGLTVAFLITLTLFFYRRRKTYTVLY